MENLVSFRLLLLDLQNYPPGNHWQKPNSKRGKSSCLFRTENVAKMILSPTWLPPVSRVQLGANILYETYWKGRCKLAKAERYNELNHEGYKQAKNYHLRSTVLQVLAEIALCALSSALCHAYISTTKRQDFIQGISYQISDPGVGNRKTKTKSWDPVELPWHPNSVAICLENYIVKVDFVNLTDIKASLHSSSLSGLLFAIFRGHGFNGSFFRMHLKKKGTNTTRDTVW